MQTFGSEMVMKINKLLTPNRMKYPWFISGALWIGWIIGMIAGTGNMDLYGNLIGSDFAGFYTAGKIILSGQSPQLYDFDLANTIQQALRAGTSRGFNPYMNTPHYSLFIIPFALIPYPWAPLLWIAFGLTCLWLSIKLLGVEHPTRSFFWSLTWFPVFAATSFGQNSFFSLAIFCLSFYFLIRKRYLFAGIIFSLMAFKPYFLIGLGFLWVLDWRRSWKAIIGLSIGIIAQIGLNLWLLPQASMSYLSFLQQTLPDLVRAEGSALWHSYSVLAFWQSLIPGTPVLPQSLYLGCLLFGLYFFVKIWKVYLNNQSIMFSAATCLLVWSTPYINTYDWTILVIPALLLWKSKPECRSSWKALFAIMWIVTLFSSEFSYVQLLVLPFSLQISTIALAIFLVFFYKLLMGTSGQDLYIDSHLISN